MSVCACVNVHVHVCVSLCVYACACVDGCARVHVLCRCVCVSVCVAASGCVINNLSYLVRRGQLQGTCTSHPAGKTSVARESRGAVLETDEHQ